MKNPSQPFIEPSDYRLRVAVSMREHLLGTLVSESDPNSYDREIARFSKCPQLSPERFEQALEHLLRVQWSPEQTFQLYHRASHTDETHDDESGMTRYKLYASPQAQNYTEIAVNSEEDGKEADRRLNNWSEWENQFSKELTKLIQLIANHMGATQMASRDNGPTEIHANSCGDVIILGLADWSYDIIIYYSGMY